MISWIGAIRIRIYVVHNSKGTKEDTVKTNSLTNLWLQPLATQLVPHPSGNYCYQFPMQSSRDSLPLHQ